VDEKSKDFFKKLQFLLAYHFIQYTDSVLEQENEK